ncbi:hypothetical protein [Thauera sinica]|uniref:Translation elongation factor EFTu/EF1A C-terminal domain-containing protein n=1 Tax=Thauera sinica TaxID=2665146 RepID=A0ABW1AKM7_9RHOO|nr:hypothetical protein [Thauera sp. K11]
MPNIVAKIRFLSTAEGGRSQALPSDTFGCPVFFEGIPELSSHGYDCRILISEVPEPVQPGDEVEKVRMLFLSPDEVLTQVRLGARFTLWEGKTIAYGEVIGIDME